MEDEPLNIHMTTLTAGYHVRIITTRDVEPTGTCRHAFTGELYEHQQGLAIEGRGAVAQQRLGDLLTLYDFAQEFDLHVLFRASDKTGEISVGIWRDMALKEPRLPYLLCVCCLAPSELARLADASIVTLSLGGSPRRLFSVGHYCYSGEFAPNGIVDAVGNLAALIRNARTSGRLEWSPSSPTQIQRRTLL